MGIQDDLNSILGSKGLSVGEVAISEKTKPSKIDDAISLRLKDILNSYISFIKENPIPNDKGYVNHLMMGYFGQVIEGIEIEEEVGTEVLKGGKEFGSSERDIIKHLSNLKPIPEGSTEDKQDFVKSVFEELYDTKSVVRTNLFFKDSIPEVRDWLEKKEKNKLKKPKKSKFLPEQKSDKSVDLTESLMQCLSRDEEVKVPEETRKMILEKVDLGLFKELMKTL